MSTVIRKISIGSDYKTDAMHYSLTQSVYGGHTISHILFDAKDKKFNSNMAISVEYDLEY